MCDAANKGNNCGLQRPRRYMRYVGGSTGLIFFFKDTHRHLLGAIVSALEGDTELTPRVQGLLTEACLSNSASLLTKDVRHVSESLASL